MCYANAKAIVMLKLSFVMKNAVAVILFLTLISTAQAQLVSGIGIMGGVTYSRQKWKIHEPPQSFNQKRILRYNGEVFIEWFSHETFRIQTELQYNMKGAKDGATGQKYKLDYFAFNNFLKIRHETYSLIPYILVGPRIEYTFRSNQLGSKTFHFGWSAGAGFETISFGPVCFLTELHYNPDIDKAGKTTFHEYYNRAFELRVGLKYKFRDSSNDCPPSY